MTPLLPRVSAAQRFWQCALRRRPAAGANSYPDTTAATSITSSCGSCSWLPGLRVLAVARSLSWCTALAVLVVISHVITGVTGSGTTLALLVAAALNLVTGITRKGIQERFVTNHDSVYSATYSQLGELAAFVVALNSLTLGGATIAMTARVFSATVNQMTNNFIGALIGPLFSQSEVLKVCDPIAGLVCWITAGLVALGVERNVWMDLVMLICTATAAVIYTVTSITLSGHNHWLRAPFLPKGVVGFTEAVGILCMVYRTPIVWTTVRPSNNSYNSCEQNPVTSGLATSSGATSGVATSGGSDCNIRRAASLSVTAVATLLLMIAYVNLANSFSLVLVFQSNGTCPAARSLDGLDPVYDSGSCGGSSASLHALSTLVGCLATLSLCVLIADHVSRQLGTVNQLASDRLLLPFSHGSCRAVIAAVTGAAAIFCSSCWLLKFAAVFELLNCSSSIALHILIRHSQLATNTLAVSRGTTCYQIARDSCPVNGDTPDLSKNSSTARQLYSGLALISYQVQHADTTRHQRSATDTAPCDATCRCEVESGSSASGYESNSSDEEDVDAILAEYLQDNPQVATMPAEDVTRLPTTGPTRRSSRRVAIYLGLLTVTAAVAGALLSSPQLSAPAVAVVAAVSAVLAVTLIVTVSRQPQAFAVARYSVDQCTWLQCVALVVTVVCWTVLMRHVWLALGIVTLAGFSCYVGYGMRNSSIAPRHTVSPHTW